MEATEHRGHWWLPGEEDDKIAGVLDYNPMDGGELELFGNITPLDNNPFEFKKVNCIIGKSVSGKYITLYNSDVRVSEISGTTPKQVAYPKVIFIGAGLPEPEFDKIKVEFPNLIEWMDGTSIKTSIERDGNKMMPSTSVEFADPITFSLEEYILEFKSNVSVGRNGQASIQYDETAAVELSSENKIQFGAAREIIKHLQHYFALSMDQSIYPDNIQGIIQKSGTKQIKGNEIEIPDIVCDVYYTVPRFSEKAQQKNKNRLHFEASDVSVPDSINRWVNHSYNADTFHELFFNIMYDPDMGIKYQFLSLCMAVESYFGHHYPDRQHMSNSDWMSLRNQIFEAIPDEAEAADRLRGLIGNIGNDYSLKDKLVIITDDHSEIISDIFDIEETVNDINNTRNDIAHGYGGDLSGSKTDPEQLIQLLFKIRIIVEICMYDIIGLSAEKISFIIDTKYDIGKIA